MNMGFSKHSARKAVPGFALLPAVVFAMAALSLTALPSFAQPKAPPKPATAASTPPRRLQPVQQSGQLDSDQALFTVLAAINAAGYDDQNDAVSTHPFRHTLRAQLSARKIDSLYDLRRFYRDHKQKDPSADLSQYISYALLINGPPSFDYKDPDMVRPPDASALEGLSPLLAAFYKEARLDELWEQAQPSFDRTIEQYHEPVSRAVLSANAYLRVATSGYLGRRFQIYVDILGAPNQVQTRSYGDDTIVVVTPTPEPQIQGIRHAYLHYLLDPLGLKFAEDINKKRALADYALGAPLLDEHYKTNFVDLTVECLIKAVEARIDRKPVMVEQALKEGFVLTPAMDEQLALFEGQDQTLRLFLPNMIASLDYRKEEKRLEKVEFTTTRTARVIRAASAKPAELTGTAKMIEDAETAYRDRDLPRAKDILLKVLEQTTEKPVHAKSYYGLARIAVLEKDPETGDRLFRKVLELEPDAETKAWSLLYIARLADSQGDRDQAIENYKAALAVEGSPESVRQAAEKGLAATFKK
jgi:tetratricopeptide (TPR) repeat protein